MVLEGNSLPRLDSSHFLGLDDSSGKYHVWLRFRGTGVVLEENGWPWLTCLFYLPGPSIFPEGRPCSEAPLGCVLCKFKDAPKLSAVTQELAFRNVLVIPWLC